MKNRRNLVPFAEIHKRWMRNPAFVREYERLQPEFEIARQIIDARITRKITQQELAIRMGTGQAVISRLENANAKPSLSLIQRLAEALDLKVELHFKPR